VHLSDSDRAAAGGSKELERKKNTWIMIITIQVFFFLSSSTGAHDASGRSR
jgi:hypothetical protein